MRKYLFTFLFVLISTISNAATNDTHLCQALNYITLGDFQKATFELYNVSDWTFLSEGACSNIDNDINRAFEFLTYADSISIDQDIIVEYGLYISYMFEERAFLYLENEDYESAAVLFEVTSQLFDLYFGKEDAIYITARSYLAHTSFLMSDYEKAKTTYLEVLALHKKLWGTEDKEYMAYTLSLGLTYSHLGDYQNAILYFLESLRVNNSLNEDADDMNATIMKLLGGTYINAVDYTQAEYYLNESLNIQRRQNVSQGIEYSTTLALLGDLRTQLGDYITAIQLYKEALQAVSSNILTDQIQRASVLRNLGSTYIETFDWEESETCLKQALELFGNIEGEKSLNYIGALSALGDCFSRRGDYQRAEHYLLKSIQLLESLTNDDFLHHENAITLLNTLDRLSILYYNLRDYDKAEKYALQELSAQEKALSGHNLKHALILCHLGSIYEAQSKYTQAETYYLEVLPILNRTLGADHPKYGSFLCNLAHIYEDLHSYKQAEHYYIQALSIFEKNREDLEGTYAWALNQIGMFYGHQGEFLKAIPYLEQAHNIREIVYGANAPLYLSSLNNLGLAYTGLGDYSTALPYLQEGFDLSKEIFIHSTQYMTDKQRDIYFETLAETFTWINPCFTYRCHYVDYSYSIWAYNNELFYKGVLLESSESIRRSVLQSGDTILINKWNELTRLKQTIYHLQEKDPTSETITEYENQAEQLEKEITRSSAAYRENQRQWNITWDSVRAELKPNQVAIEYMSAPLNKDSTMYCALLLRDTYSYPILIPLFEEKQATSLISNDEGETYSYNESGAALSALIWRKVLPYIKPGESVYFAPTGLLHQLAIETLPYDANRTMDDVFNLVRVSSTRELVLHRSSETHTTATLYGGIQYDMDATDMEAASRQYQGEQLLASRSFGAADINRGHANYLPGTKAEAEQIKKLLTSNRITARLYTDNAANEESFKALSGKHQNVLHIATHGFYWTDSTAQRQKYFTQYNTLMGEGQPTPSAIDPLNRCGLLFAGANIALQGYSDELPEGVQDGILTAKEISLLDLRDANLVVLSACETGKGEITGDGVFGLQRAFKMAGAQTIIMSLWKVSDNATQLLMTEFYRNWITLRQPKREAFRSARNTVRTRYKEPTYWAGFIMLE